MTSIVSSRILFPQNHILQHDVLKQNLHQPCGELSACSFCMKEYSWLNQTLKAFVEDTRQEEGQFGVVCRQQHPSTGGQTASRR